MTYEIISRFAEINEVDEKKVEKIAVSIKKNGWIGCPILIANESLITGSHRLAALKLLEENGELDYDMNVAEDVTDLVDEAFIKFEDENGYVADLEYDNLGWIFEGTWVDAFKDEIEEW